VTLFEQGLWITVTGMLVAAACALPGTFLVLRRMSLIGDAISHAVLPGIVIAFLAGQTRHPLAMLAGAAAAGLLTVWLVEVLHRSRLVNEDTAVAVVFPTLFALGVLLIARYARYVDLDTDCVLYGAIEQVPQTYLRNDAPWLGPEAVWVLGPVLLVNLAVVVLCYKELKVTTFDPALAQTLGIPPALFHYLLMVLVAVTTVAAFQAVGAILVVAFLIIPPATAYLLTDRLSVLLPLAVLLGMAAAAAGYPVAQRLNCTTGGVMASLTGLVFLAVWLVAPRYGLLATLGRRWRQRRAVRAGKLVPPAGWVAGGTGALVAQDPV
jgi:manganese/zinc/iron transport system permease protein